jgi:hypothetical protein
MEGHSLVHTLTVRRAAGVLLVIVPLGFTVCFTLLQQLFEYPDILRQPTADVLTKFAAGGTPLVVVWYALTLSAVAFIPLTLREAIRQTVAWARKRSSTTAETGRAAHATTQS